MTTHGGKRRGAGRKPSTGKTVRTLSTTVTRESYDQVALVAAECGKTMSEWIKLQIARGVCQHFEGVR